jgi:hypothetical protein
MTEATQPSPPPPPRAGGPGRIVASLGLVVPSVVVIVGVVMYSAAGANGDRATASVAPSVAASASAAVADRLGSPPPRPSASTAPEPVHRIGERVTVVGLAAHTVLRAEDWGDPSADGRRGLAVRVRVEALKDDTTFDFQNYQVFAAGGVFSAQTPGKQPSLAYGSLRRADEAVGWVTFLVPPEGPYVLSIRTPLGYNGLDETIKVALDPIEPASPDPTPGPTITPRPRPTQPTTLANYGYPTTIGSTYYSGYGATLPGSSVSEVHGEWIEPKARCTGSTERDAAFWVGIEDATGQFLQQLGTLAVCAGGTSPTYHAWYEMFPLRSVPIKMTIHPGDRMSATVSVDGSAWRLALTNVTTGAEFATTKQRSAEAAIALWIAEAPSTSTTNVGSHVLPLADYGTVTFRDCTAVVTGGSHTLSDRGWAHFRFDMAAASGVAKAVTSATSSGGTSFRSTWRHS